MDLCSVERIEKAMGERFLNRYYTPEERSYIASRGAMGAQSAAAMFAAKEAFLKAIGTGIGAGVELADIGVEHTESGAPYYVLSTRAEEKMKQLGGSHAFLSLSHEAGVAAAVCVIE